MTWSLVGLEDIRWWSRIGQDSGEMLGEQNGPSLLDTCIDEGQDREKPSKCLISLASFEENIRQHPDLEGSERRKKKRKARSAT